MEAQLLATDSDEVKRLISQDQFTVLSGEVVDLLKQQTGFGGTFDALNPGGVETDDYAANREVFLPFGLISSGQLASASAAPTMNRITLYTKERQVRQFETPRLRLVAQGKLPEVARFAVQHTTREHVLLVGPDFVDKYLLQVTQVARLARFRINYCS